MKYFTLNKQFMSLLLLIFCFASFASTTENSSPYTGTWLSVVPPLLAIVIALVFKQVIPALFTGLVFGVWVIGGLTVTSLVTAPMQTLEIYAVKALADEGHVSIVLFSFMIGGMVGITSRNGGMQGIVNLIIKWANTVKRACLSTIAMGMSIFFDDYANTLVVGNTMRPVTDQMKISREKLAYLVDSTAAPVACLAFVTTWVGFQVGLIDEAMKAIGYSKEGGYAVFLQTIPYSFYPILALLLTLMVAFTGKDIGPMYQAELRARAGEVAPPTEERHSEEEILPVENKPQRALNAILPFATMILVVLYGLYITGLNPEVENQSLRDIVGNSDSYKALLWGTMSGVLVAAILSVIQGILTLQQTVNAWLKGIKPMILAMVILTLAWALSAVSEQLQTSQYISSMIEDTLSVHWLPILTFLLAALTAFATGSSWGAMGILIPLIVPIGWNMLTAQYGIDSDQFYIIYITLASILAGAVWGDHCSPISDTTILSSMASGCDHIEHVRTQIPYAFLAGGFAMLMGIIPASYGLSPWIAIIISSVGMFIALQWKGKAA